MNERVSRTALWAMIIIAGILLFVSIYANVQKLRRGKVEKITFTPAVISPTPKPAP